MHPIKMAFRLHINSFLKAIQQPSKSRKSRRSVILKVVLGTTPIQRIRGVINFSIGISELISGEPAFCIRGGVR